MIVFGAGLAAALAASGAAMAQPLGAPGANYAEQRLAMQQAERSARLESRIAFARSLLTITPEQSAVWDGFAEALRFDLNARTQARLQPDGIDDDLLSLPEKLERRRARLATHSQRAAAFANAVTPLYAALDPQQRAMADRIFDEDDDGRVRIRDFDRD
jgi:hypothetical protein